jgi:lipopolysaccharide export LptBFGC system permease protein LptF
MKRFKQTVDSVNPGWDLSKERTVAENNLNQRLALFLIVFLIVFIGSVNTSKKLFFLSLLFVGVLICWILAYTIIKSTKKINRINKELYSADDQARRIDKKTGGRSSRWLLGYFVPICCCILLTMALLAGSFGFLDPYLTITVDKAVQIENNVESKAVEFKKEISREPDNSSKYFKSVDTVIAQGKVINSKSKTDKFTTNEIKPIVRKNYKSDPNFKNVETVISNGK